MLVNTVPLQVLTFLSPNIDLASFRSESLLLVSDSVTANPELENSLFFKLDFWLIFSKILLQWEYYHFELLVEGGLCPRNLAYVQSQI